MNSFYDRIKYIYTVVYKNDRKSFAEAMGVGYSQAGNILRGASNMSEAAKQLLVRNANLNIHWLETGEGEPFLSMAAEDRAPYFAGPVASELLSVIAQLDAADQERILQEAKDRLLLKKLKEQIDRGQPGGGSQERQRPAIPPQPQKKGRRQTA
jgi:hypothetical protein